MRLQQLKGGQLVVSVPRSLAVALGWRKGDEVVFKLQGSRLYLERED